MRGGRKGEGREVEGEGRKGKGERWKGEWRMEERGVEKGAVAGAGASGALRILTSLLSLKSYIEAVRPLYSEFHVQSSILGSSSSRDISTIITSLADTENYLTDLSTSACQLLGLKSAIQGPYGVPAA